MSISRTIFLAFLLILTVLKSWVDAVLRVLDWDEVKLCFASYKTRPCVVVICKYVPYDIPYITAISSGGHTFLLMTSWSYKYH